MSSLELSLSQTVFVYDFIISFLYTYLWIIKTFLEYVLLLTDD